MNAIPTHYNGINFRSRLEARWAKVFDLLGWEYEYEPLDMDGYIPDFYLLGDYGCYVEVKPAMTRSQLASMNEKSYKALAKSGERMLYLGATYTWKRAYQPYDVVEIGDIVEFPKVEEQNIWSCEFARGDATIVVCPSCQKLSFLDPEGLWHTHCCGAHTKRHECDPSRLHDLWKQSGNTTQYKRIFLAK